MKNALYLRNPRTGEVVELTEGMELLRDDAMGGLSYQMVMKLAAPPEFNCVGPGNAITLRVLIQSIRTEIQKSHAGELPKDAIIRELQDLYYEIGLPGARVEVTKSRIATLVERLIGGSK